VAIEARTKIASREVLIAHSTRARPFVVLGMISPGAAFHTRADLKIGYAFPEL